MRSLTTHLRLDTLHLADLGDHLRLLCGDDVAPGVVASFELALHEIATNVIRHSQATTPAEVTLCLCRDRLTATVEDDGIPFDLAAAPPVTPGEVREHGYGLHLAARLVDQLSLTRTAGRNRWRLTLELHP